MTTVLAKLTRSGGGYIQLDALAPGPSGGAYAIGNDVSGDICVARLNSDGTLNWAKDITIPTLTPAYCAAASSSNRLAIAASSGDSFSATTCIVMLDDTERTIGAKSETARILARIIRERMKAEEPSSITASRGGSNASR